MFNCLFKTDVDDAFKPFLHHFIKTCFFNFNILTLDNINNYQVLLFMFQLYNNQYPRPDSFPLLTGSQIHTHFTRSAHHLRPQFARIQVKQFSIMCNGPLLWKKLPESVKNLKSIGSFKKSIKLLLMQFKQT